MGLEVIEEVLAKCREANGDVITEELQWKKEEKPTVSIIAERYRQKTKKECTISKRFVVENYTLDDVDYILRTFYQIEVGKSMEQQPQRNQDALNFLNYVSHWLTLKNFTKEEENEEWGRSIIKKWGVALLGGCGTGKTTLARTVINLINELYPSQDKLFRKAREVSAMDLINIKKTEDKNDLFMYCKHVQCLLIDDVGCEPSSVNVYGNKETPLVEILLERYNYKKLTIITSNLRQAELTERYGDRVGDRLNEMFQFFPIRGESFR